MQELERTINNTIINATKELKVQTYYGACQRREQKGSIKGEELLLKESMKND